MSLSVGFQIPYLFAILVLTPPLIWLPTLSVCTGVYLRSTSSGVWTLKEFARFIRSLESNFSTILRKILSGLPSAIGEDAVFHSSVEDRWTVASSLSASWRHFGQYLEHHIYQTYLRSSLGQVSYFDPADLLQLYLLSVCTHYLSERF